MPRDSKGNVFGHGSKMATAAGDIITVAGFATIAQGRIDIKKLSNVFGKKYQYFRWVDLTNVDPNEKSLAALDTTDHCAVDRAQASGNLSAANDSGDKVIWGS